MITKKDVQHIAKLARLGMTEAEIERFRKDLSSVLGYVGKLKTVDVSKTPPTSHPFEIENVVRRDESQKSRLRQGFGGQAKLLDLAPETKNGYIKVKSILK